MIAELVNNEWKINNNLIFDRNYTDQILEIRDSYGRIVLQVAHFGDTVHLAGIFRCRSGWSGIIGPIKQGAIIDINPPYEDFTYEIPPVCRYPSEKYIGNCPGINRLKKIIQHGPGPPAYRLAGSLNLCEKAGSVKKQ